jgi:hypothetical protein
MKMWRLMVAVNIVMMMPKKREISGIRSSLGNYFTMKSYLQENLTAYCHARRSEEMLSVSPQGSKRLEQVCCDLRYMLA